MNRVEQIKTYLTIAEREEKKSSLNYWEASRLIWEEVTAGTSRRSLATSIGKSHTHVRYMFNAWDMVGRKDGLPIEQLPNFNTVYNSAEIRGDYDPDGGDGGDDEERQGSHRRRGQEPEDYSAHGLVMQAANSLDALHRNKAYIPLLTDEDKTLIRELMPVLRALIHDIGR